MKILIVGTGSVGLRHLKNLLDLEQEVYAVDLNRKNLHKASLYAKRTFHYLDKALEVKPDIAFICTFSNTHISLATECASSGCHLFIEKPLSLDLKGIEKLIALVEKKRLISMVGCNMRFHPAISYIYKLLNSNPAFAEKLYADIEYGYYLPFAKKDYSSSYMANKSKGGNLIFDSIHELDYAMWLFGEPVDIFCSKDKLSDLKLDVDDNADIMIRFKSGLLCNIHLDYLQHGYSRRCKVVCSDATVIWDFTYGKIGIVTAGGRTWKWKDLNLGIYYNQMYIDEIKYFLHCVMKRKDTLNSIRQSLVVLKLAILADKGHYAKAWQKFRKT